jgi:hypothetical protein
METARVRTLPTIALPLVVKLPMIAMSGLPVSRTVHDAPEGPRSPHPAGQAFS